MTTRRFAARPLPLPNWSCGWLFAPHYSEVFFTWAWASSPA